MRAVNVRNGRVNGGHMAHSPHWAYETCGDPWPCRAFRSIPEERLDRANLIAVMSLLMRTAIRDLRGRPEGPEPPEIVKRFLWLMPLNDEEARALALRMR